MLSLGRHYFRFRLIILCMACVLPSGGIILYEITSGINQSIDTARLEMAGNAYQRPLELLLEKVPLYGLSVATDGKVGGEPATALKDEVDRAFMELMALQERLGEALQITANHPLAHPHAPALIPPSAFPMPATMLRKWEALVAEAGETSPDQWNADVDGLTSDIRKLIVHIGDSSHLILDPDLDTYYLMDMTLCKMPQSQDRLDVILRHEGELTPGAPLPPETRQKLAVDAAMLGEVDLPGILGDAQTCLAANAGFYGKSRSLQRNLPAMIEPYQAASQALLASLGQISHGEFPSQTGELLSRTGLLRAQSFQLWNTSVAELDLLLQHRIAALIARRSFYILLTLATLAATFVLAWSGFLAENLRVANQQLERKVADRTRELEAAYRELEMFSYSVSHDLRGPLRGINGSCALLIKRHGSKMEAEVTDCIERIDVATQRMGQIIDDLLLLSRVGRSKLALQPVDLSTLANRIVGELRASAPDRAVIFDITPGLSCQADYRLMQNVLENLLGNAWKYTSRKPQARITFDAFENEGRRVFRVRDDGAGFDMRFVQKLFQSFQRLHDQTEFEGTGVGLAIVARIIHRHGGKVWAEGTVGEGAAFYFALGKSETAEKSEAGGSPIFQKGG